ncbi:ribonuclease P protein component [Flaviflexus huanghaiensis]|uniref:ribonuclease P protein component n=1 Tax=Flaviflexus huanghaiensis TaxID=1111473 RepID=UPI0018875106
MRSSGDFRATTREGVRGKAQSLMIHLRSPDRADIADWDSALVGFVVPKTVGNAVQRNRVRRQLRHLMRERLNNLDPGSALVIRVYPGAAGRPSDELAEDLDSALAKAKRRLR